MNIVKRLCGIATSDSTIMTDQVAQIRSFIVNFRRFSQTPEYIHMILKFEFALTFMFDSYKLRDCSKETLDRELLAEWPNHIFFVVDHSFVEEWLTRILLKWKELLDQNRTLDSQWVLLLPARTSASWFHDLVLKNAKEIRFLKGSTIIPCKLFNPVVGADKDFIDAYFICILDSANGRREVSMEPEEPVKVRMIQLSTKFTDDTNELRVTEVMET